MSIQDSTESSSSSNASYQKYCCCLCTVHGSNALFDRETFILQSPSLSGDSLSNLKHRAHNHSYQRLQPNSTASRRLTTTFHLVVPGGVVYLLQSLLFSILFPVYPMQLMRDYDLDAIYIGLIVISPALFLMLTVCVLNTIAIVNYKRLPQCIVLSLIAQGTLYSSLFAFIPFIAKTAASPSKVTYALYMVTRVAASILTGIIEVAMLALLSQIIPRRVLLRQQRMFILSMVGLMAGPFLSAFLSVVDSAAVFVVVGVVAIVCALVCYCSLRSLSLSLNHGSVTYMKTPSICFALQDVNVFYSTLLHTHALVCITFVLTALSFYLCEVDAARFNIDTRLGLVHIATYYLAFGASFIILSFPVSALVSQHCGSLRTMLIGMGGMALGLLLICISGSATSLGAIDNDKPLKFIVAGLLVMGVSSAFTVTPYSLYLRSALYKKCRKQTVSVAFNVHRCSMCVALSIGPMLACVAYSMHIEFETLFFMLSLASLVLSFAGWTLFKCLRWKRKGRRVSDRPRLSSSLLDGPPLKSTIPNPVDQQIASYANIRYLPILQDDKRCWCCCAHLLCFCSLGALWDRLHHNLDVMDYRAQQQQPSSRRKTTCKLNQRHKTSYHSLEATDNLLPSSEKNDVTGQLVTVVANPTGSYRKWTRPSVGAAAQHTGHNGHNYAPVYGHNHTAPPTPPDEWRARQALAQSWKTIAGLSMGTSSATPSPLAHAALHKKVYETTEPTVLSREKSPARSAPKSSIADREREHEAENDVDVEMSVSRKHLDGGDVPDTPDIAAADASSNKNDDVFMMENTSGGSGYTLNSMIPVYSVMDIMDQKQQPSTRRSKLARPLTFDPSEESERKSKESRASTASPAPQMTPVFTGAAAFAHRHAAKQRQSVRNRNAVPANVGIFVREPSAASAASSVNEHSATDAQSQTFLLLSDDDFLSRRDSDDIYNAVPEIQDESSSTPPEQ